jgi:hypothetical protein
MNPEPIIPTAPSKPIVTITPPVKKDKFSKTLKIIIVLVLLILIALGTFWGGMYYSENHSSASKTAKNNAEVTPTPTPTAVATVSPTPEKQELKDVIKALPTPTPSAKPTPTTVNPYKDWKTYTSADMKVSIKYKSFDQISYDKESGTLEVRGNGKSAMLNLYDFARIEELNVGKNSETDQTYLNPKGTFSYLAEEYANAVTVKVANVTYAMRHLLYGDGPMNDDPSKCDSSSNGFEKLYTEIYKASDIQVYYPVGVEIHYSLLTSNTACKGQDAPSVKEQKAEIAELVQMVESITFN